MGIVIVTNSYIYIKSILTLKCHWFLNDGLLCLEGSILRSVLEILVGKICYSEYERLYYK